MTQEQNHPIGGVEMKTAETLFNHHSSPTPKELPYYTMSEAEFIKALQEHDQEIIQMIDKDYNQAVKDRTKKRAELKKNKVLKYVGDGWASYFNGKIIALTELKQKLEKK